MMEELPNNWKQVLFDDIVDFITDYQANGSFATLKENVQYFKEPNYAVLVRLKDLRTSMQSISEFVYTDERGYDFLKKSRVQEGDLLVANVGSVGVTVKMPKVSFKATLAPNMFRVDLNSNYSKQLFLHYSKSAIYWEELKRAAGGSTSQPKINKSQYRSISIPFPPLAEQHRIVAKIEELFSSLDKGIETLKTAQQQLKVYRQAVLKWAFEGRLTNPELKEGELPEGWVEKSLEELTLPKTGLRRGPFGSAIKKEFFVPNGYKVYEQSNAIYNDAFRGKYFINQSKFNELKNFEVVEGDFIVSCSGTLGKITQIPKGAPHGIINQALLRIRLIPNTISSKYFLNYFRSEFFQRLIFDQSQGTAMNNLIGIKDFKEIKLFMPIDEKVQNHVVDELESRLSVCDKIEESIIQSLQQAEALRQSILKKAFEGKLVPQDPNDEPAGVLLERIKKIKHKPRKQ